MSVRVMSMVWEYSQAKGGDLLILLSIADHADDNGRAFPGEERLAKKGRMTERNVRHCLQGLQIIEELSIIPGGGRGKSNHYQINLDVLLSRAKEGNIFQEKISRKELPGKNNLEKSDTNDPKPGKGFPPNHQLTTTITTKEDPPLPPPPSGEGDGEDPPKKVRKPRKPRLPKELPTYDPEGYQQFFAAYPCHKDLDKAVQAWDWLQPDNTLQTTILKDISRRRDEDQKWADGYIPYPFRYLRDRRWRDDITPIRARASPNPPVVVRKSRCGVDGCSRPPHGSFCDYHGAP